MNAYRRAAIVVASLDRRAADDLLDRLPVDQSRAIRDELILLDETNDEEQHDAIEEYLKPDLTVERSVASECIVAESIPTEPSETLPNDLSSVLRELLTQKDDSLAESLRHERASIVAALLQRLPQKRAAGILILLPAPLQRRILSNLNHGRVASLDLVDVIADRLCEKHAERVEANGTEQHVDALQAIFNELSRDEQREMLRSLAEENPMLAQRLVPTLPSTQASNDCYC